MYGEASYFSLNKKCDWEKGWADNFHIEDSGISLKTTLQYAVSQVVRVHSDIPDLDISDLTVKSGQFYLLDAGANILVYDYRNSRADVFIRAGQGLFTGQAGIALLKDTVVVADPQGKQKITAFSTANGQILWSVDSLYNYAIYPLAVAADGNDSLYVVAGQGIIRINPAGRVMGVFGGDQLKLGPEYPAQKGKRRFFATGSGNGICVLDAEDNLVYGFSREGQPVLQFSPDLPTRPSGIVTDRENNIYIGDSEKTGPGLEESRFLYKFDSTGRYLGMVSGFRGCSDKLLTDEKNVIYVWNGEEVAVSILEQNQRIQGADGSGQPRGTYISTSLDSTAAEMQWHKLVMDAEVPEDTQIIVSYFCADRKNVLMNGKYIDLDDYINDQSIPALEKIDSLAPYWSQPVVNPYDALMHGARGRYLWLKMEFTGNGGKTPLMKRIRIYYPRTSYLGYLPAVYQEDGNSRDFLERYLALFQSFLLDMEEKIGGVAKYFDPDVASGPFLKWLAGWLAIVVDDSWGEDQLRRLVKKSPELYKRRGTRQSIEEIIEIYTGQKPFIVEYFQFKYLKDHPQMKGVLEKLYGMDPYCFSVLVRQECVATEQRRLALNKIIDQEKPAFSEARLVVLEPWIYMDMHTYLGINTCLSELTPLMLDRGFTIPNNTVLVDVDMDNRIGTHSRMDLDTKIEY